MADLLNRANVDTAINTLLDDAQPNEAIQPSDHNGLLKNILDTLANGLSVTLRTNPETAGQDIEITSGDKLKYKNSTFFNSVVTDTLTADRTLTLPNKTGTIAILSDIENLFTDDLTLGANRSHNAVEYDWKITHNATDGSVNAVGIDTGKISHAGSRTATNSSYATSWFWGQFSSLFTNTSTNANTTINQTNSSLQLTNTDSVNDTTFLNLSSTTYNANHTGATTQSDLALTGTQSTLINQSGIGTNLATAKLDLTNSNSIFYYDVGDTISYIEAGPLKTFLKFEETGATPGGGVFQMSRSTGHSFTDNNTNGSGLLYGADYSANYTSRSLVDKAYVDSSAGGDSIYTADGTLSGARTVDLDANLLTFDTDTGGQIRLNRSDYSSTDIFKIIGYTAGGNLPFFKVGSYGQVELMGRLNASAFKVYKSGSTSEVCFDTGGTNGGGFIGKGIVTIGESTSSYAYRNQSASSYSFNRWYRGGNIEHCFNFDSSNPLSFTGFYINGVGNDYFVVGSGAKISTEKISLQDNTVIKGSDTLSTSSALRIYDGDTTPAVLWAFRNNGDIVQGKNAVIDTNGKTLRFDSSASYVVDPFKFQTYPFGGTGTNPYLKIKAYGEVEIRSSLNDIFRLKDGGGGDKFKVNSTQTSVYGNLLVTTTYFKMQSSTQALKFTNTSTGNLTHEIQTDGGGSPVKTKFNIIGGTSEFIVGANAVVGSEKISLQGDTLLNSNVNMPNLPTSSAGLSSGDVWNDGGTLKIV